MLRWKKSVSAAVVSSDRMLNSTGGESRDSPADQPRHRPFAARGASGARPRGSSLTRGSRGALNQVRSGRAAHQLAYAAPSPTARERDAPDAGTHRNQLSVIDNGPCRRARRTLSIVLDGEASATEAAESAGHLRECDDCARFAAVIAELKQCLRAAAPETPEVRKALERRCDARASAER